MKFVKQIHVVAVENEVKELLFLLEKNYTQEIDIKTFNISEKGNQQFNFSLNKEISASYSKPKKYLFEPNAAILKAGAFNQISAQLKLNKFLMKRNYAFYETFLAAECFVLMLS